ncbi:MAG: gliding motility-associated C-terminal domain-containing protein [Bacteroidales bacterium]|nr:gliding motility-associated C-terminal domain-containing protein [Bacteroidales bacterium]
MVKICFKALLLLIFWIPVNLNAQAPPWSWTKGIHSSGEEMSTDCRLDSVTGDILMTGDFDSDLSDYLGDGSAVSTDFTSTYGNSDGFVARFDKHGNELWAFKIGGSGNDRISSIDIAQDGNIYITGHISNGTCHFTGTSSKIADDSVDNTYGQTGFLAKYSAKGALLWFRIAETPDGDAGGNIVKTGDKEVYLSGYGNGDITFGGLSENLDFGGSDFFVVKYNPDGLEQWIFKGGTSEDDRLADMHIGTEFLHIAANYKADKIEFYHSGGSPAFSFTNSYSGKYQLVMCSYDKEGDNNAQYESDGNDNVIGNGITMIEDSLYITGRIGSDSFFGYPVTPSNESDIFIASMSKWAQVGWIKTIPCTDSKEEGTDIDKIENQYLAITGNYHYTLDFWGDTTLTASDAQDAFISVITSNGSFKWAKSVGGTNNEYSNAVDGNIYGEIYLAGHYLKDIQFDSVSYPSDDGNNIFLAKTDLNYSGEPLPMASAGLDQTLCGDSTTFLDGNAPNGDYTGTWLYLPGIIWKEDFNDLADGTTEDTDPPSEWSLTQTSSQGYAEVRSGKFEVSGNDDTVEWTSETIDISEYSNTKIFIDLESWTDGQFESDDYIRAYSRVDGTEKALTNGLHEGAIGNLTGSGSGGYHSVTARDTIPAGDSLEIVIRILNDEEDSEIYRFDNVFVVEESSGDDPVINDPHDPGTQVTEINYGINTFMWSFTHDTLPTSRDLMRITRYQKPVADPGTGGDTCGLSFDLEASLSTDTGSGYWEKTSGPASVKNWSDSPEQDATTVTVKEAGEYEFTWTEVKGDCADSDTITVNFLELPIADVGEDKEIQKGEEIQLNATGGTEYLWSPSYGLSDTTVADPVASPDATTSYTVSVTNTEGCADSDDVTVKVFAPEFADAEPDTAICRGNPVQLFASGGISYQWKPVSGLSDSETANPTAQPDTTTTYKVIVRNEEGHADTANVTVEINPLPELNVPDEYELCKGDTLRLSTEGTGDFQWSPSEGLSRTDVSQPLAFPLNTTTYRVALTNEHQCTQTSKTKVKVYRKPNAYAGADKQLEYKFETNLNAGRPVTGAGEWSAVKGNAEFEDKSDPQTTVSGLELDENILLWSVDNGVCPVSEDRVHITVKDLLPPTVITPNNDGKNDHFRVPGLENTECEEFIVFNRWGNEIYREKNYQGDWDGINKWGEKVTADTYYYILKLKSGRVLKGYFDIAH